MYHSQLPQRHAADFHRFHRGHLWVIMSNGFQRLRAQTRGALPTADNYFLPPKLLVSASTALLLRPHLGQAVR